jgi:hypothetical protein
METYKIGSEVSAYLPDEIRELEDRPVIRQKTPIPRDLVPVEEA